MSSKRVLMVCTNDWNSTFQVGSHHLAREFVNKGYEVAFISDPISPFHLLGNNRKELKRKFQIYSAGGIRDLDGKLWGYVPGCWLPPHRKSFFKSLWVHRYWYYTTVPSIVAKVLEQGFGKVDLLYFDTALQPFWLKEIEARRSVFRVADNSSGFTGYPAALTQLENELMRSVDLVVGTAGELVKKIEGRPVKRLEHLPNGVPFSNFIKEEQKPIEYEKIPGPIAVYVGAIENWFAFNLLKKVARQLPQVSFVLIGPSPLAEVHLGAVPNIHILGPSLITLYRPISNMRKSGLFHLTCSSLAILFTVLIL
jgi:hypothetical protein